MDSWQSGVIIGPMLGGFMLAAEKPVFLVLQPYSASVLLFITKKKLS